MFLQSILLGIGLVLCLLYFVQFYRRKEGFDSRSDKILDNALSPLASSMSPLGTSVAPMGVSVNTGHEIKRDLSSALHFDMVVPDGEGGIMKSDTMPDYKPRIDDETSFMGHVKYCQEQGATENPFSDLKFQKLCGMCMTEGILTNGKQFTTPTGIVVYPEDKDAALEEKRKNGYPFSRVIPSYKSATCAGAATTSKAMPSIALNASEYALMKANKACEKVNRVGENGCAMCLPTGKKSYIPPSASVENVELFVYGCGSLDYRIGSASGTVVLHETNVQRISLGVIEEGSAAIFTITRDTRLEGPFISGFFQSTTPRNAKFKLPIDRLSLTTDGSQGPPKKGRNMRSVDFGGPLPYLYSYDQTAEAFTFTGFFPFTFVQPSELAAFYCPTGPFMKKESSASQFSKDPCVGQTDGSLSDACLRSKIEENGCSSAGTLYKSPQDEGMGQSIMSFVNKVAQYANMSKNDREAAKKCTGKTFPTSCDSILSGRQPSDDCLNDIYLNSLVDTPFGSSYPESSLAYTSINYQTGKPMYCQSSGSLMPRMDDERKSNELRTIYTNGYAGKYGLDAVRKFLSYTFNRATDDNLSPNIPDSQGGRKTSFEKCFTEFPNTTPIERHLGPVMFYRWCDYRDERGAPSRGVGRYDTNQMGIADNDARSIRIPRGYKVTIYDGANFQGYSLIFYSDVPCLSMAMANGSSWNDKMSSYIIEYAGDEPVMPSANYQWPTNYSRNTVYRFGATISDPWSGNETLMAGVRAIPNWASLVNSMFWIWFRENPLPLRSETRGIYKIYQNPYSVSIQVKFHWVIFGYVDYLGLNNRAILPNGSSQDWFNSVDLTIPPGESILQVNCRSISNNYAGFLGVCLRNGSEVLFKTDASWGWMQHN